MECLELNDPQTSLNQPIMRSKWEKDRNRKHNLHIPKTGSYREIATDGGEFLVDIVDVLGLRMISVIFNLQRFRRIGLI